MFALAFTRCGLQGGSARLEARGTYPTKVDSSFAGPAVSIPVHLAGIGAMPSRDPARVHPAQRRAVGEGPALAPTTGWSCRRWFGVRLRRSRGARPRSRRSHCHGVALGENGFQCARLAPVDGENVLLPHLDDPTCKPAPVPFRQPLGRVLVVFLVPIHRRTCERQIQRVIGEPAPGVRAGGAQPAVMRLGTGHQVLDVGLPLRVKPLPRIGRVDAAEVRDDGVFDALRVAVVVRVVTGATLFGCYAEAPPGLLRGRRRYGGHRGGSENCPEDNCFGAARDQGRYVVVGGCNLRCNVGVMSSRQCMALLGLRCNLGGGDAGRRFVGYAGHANRDFAALRAARADQRSAFPAVPALLLSWGYAVSTASRRSMPVGDRRSIRAFLRLAMRGALAGGQRVPAPTGRTGQRSAFPGGPRASSRLVVGVSRPAAAMPV